MTDETRRYATFTSNGVDYQAHLEKRAGMSHVVVQSLAGGAAEWHALDSERSLSLHRQHPEAFQALGITRPVDTPEDWSE